MAETFILEDLEKVAIIFHAPSHPGNVGATARAMKVMGLTDLRIVNPRFTEILSLPQAIAFASGASDILANAQIFPTVKAGQVYCKYCQWLFPNVKVVSYC